MRTSLLQGFLALLAPARCPGCDLPLPEGSRLMGATLPMIIGRRRCAAALSRNRA